MAFSLLDLHASCRHYGSVSLFAAIQCSYIFSEKLSYVKSFKKEIEHIFRLQEYLDICLFSFLCSFFKDKINFLKHFLVVVVILPDIPRMKISLGFLSLRSHLHFVIERSLPLNYSPTSLETHLRYVCGKRHRVSRIFI